MPISPPTHPSAEQDPRVFFAAERTYLAWIRTGLGLMGVGFALSRFSLFLRELNASHSTPRSAALPHGSGIALVLLGVLVNLGATVRHVQLVRELREGSWQPGRPSRQAIALAILLAVGGLAMALYLALAR